MVAFATHPPGNTLVERPPLTRASRPIERIPRTTRMPRRAPSEPGVASLRPRPPSRFFAALFAIASLSACGGGGSSPIGADEVVEGRRVLGPGSVRTCPFNSSAAVQGPTAP